VATTVAVALMFTAGCAGAPASGPSTPAVGQATVKWASALGVGCAQFNSVTADPTTGNVIAVGSAQALGGGDATTGCQGDNEAFAAMFAPDGTKLWEKTYGASGVTVFGSVAPGSDGGFVVFGLLGLADGYVLPDGGGIVNRQVVAHLDQSGNLAQTALLDPTKPISISPAVVTEQGIFAVGHPYRVKGSDKMTSAVARLTTTGDIDWYSVYDEHVLNSLVGLAADASGDVFAVGVSADDLTSQSHSGLVVKYDSTGALVWSKTWWENPTDEFALCTLTGVAALGGGRIAVSGIGCVQPEGSTPAASGNAVLAVFSEDGAPVWDNWYGGSGGGFDAVTVAADGNIVAVGAASPTTGQTPSADQPQPAAGMVSVVTPEGTLVSQGVVGGDGRTEFMSAVPLPDGSIVAAGNTTARTGDVATPSEALRAAVIVCFEP